MSNEGNITKEWELYMLLLRCAIRGEKLQKEHAEQFFEIESDRIIKRAGENGQLFLLENYIEEYARFRGEDTKPRHNDIGRVIYEGERYKCIRKVVSLAKENNITFVLFKGCVLADLYPQYMQRTSCDTDIFVYEEDKQKALKLLTDAGYDIIDESSKDKVTVLEYEKAHHVIELHTCLWEDYEGRRLDILESMGLTDRNKLIQLQVCGFEATTLDYEDHLLYQLFHIIKHFSLEGVGVKYLSDITLYVDKYGKYIDYNDLWRKLESLGYEKFSHYLFAVCIEFLGMNGEILEGRNMEMGSELMDFMLDLFRSGSVFEGHYDSWQIMGMMTPYFVGEKKGPKSKLGRKIAVIFPRAKDLQDCFGYAKKNPILLPIAWIHRAVKYCVRYHKNSDKWYNTGEKLDIAEYRINLMDKMGLLG